MTLLAFMWGRNTVFQSYTTVCALSVAARVCLVQLTHSPAVVVFGLLVENHLRL